MTFPNRSSLIEFKANDAPITKGEEFSNRSKGAKLGWLKRSRINAAQARQKRIKDKESLIIERELAGSKVEEYEKQYREDQGRELVRKRVERESRYLIDNPNGRDRTGSPIRNVLTLTPAEKAQLSEIGGNALGATSIVSLLALGLNRKKLIPLGKNLLNRSRTGVTRKMKEVVPSAVTVVKESADRASKRVSDKVAKDITTTLVPKAVRDTVETISKTKKEAVEALEELSTKPSRIDPIVKPSSIKVEGAAKTSLLDSFRNRIKLKVENDKKRVRNLRVTLEDRAEKDILRRKKNLGFSRRDEFWINFNERREFNLEFNQDRRPMSEATKRKISRSLARSQGGTSGYEDSKRMKSDGGGFIATLGNLTKALDPLLKYKTSQDKLKESKRRRSLAALNTGVKIASPGLTYVGRKNALRQRLTAAEVLSQRRSQDLQRSNAVRAAASIRSERVGLIKARAFKWQTAAQSLRELRESGISISTDEARSLFGLK